MSARADRKPRGFTLIELLVVVAIIALLISILLPSLSKAREQAKAAVCASQLKNFGHASALYETDYKSFAPCDPWELMPWEPAGYPGLVRNPNMWGQRVDPAHGFLAVYAMRMKAHIENQACKPWEDYPYGFRMQSVYNPDDLYQGFFCPSQNKRNTIDEKSPELDPLHDHEGYPIVYKYASGYMVNRHLRSASTKNSGTRPGVRWPAKPNAQYVDALFRQGTDDDNVFGASDRDGVQFEFNSRFGYWHTQAVTADEVVAPADVMYMCDSLDYHLAPSPGSPSKNSIPYSGTGWTAGTEQSPGLWYNPYPGAGGTSSGPGTTHRQHVVLGARHNGKANVLYADGHVSRDGQVPRDRRGDLVIASTFSDYIDQYRFGTQHHLGPFWRRP